MAEKYLWYLFPANLLIHSLIYRLTHSGADRIKSHNYEDSILNQEVFWLGESKSGCPTMVVRSQLHDGTLEYTLT